MPFQHWAFAAVMAALMSSAAAEFTPARQLFRQETSRQFSGSGGLPAGAVQLIDFARDGSPRAFMNGQWYECQRDHWQPIPDLTSKPNEFVFADQEDRPVAVTLPWREVQQLARFGPTNYLATAADPFKVVDGRLTSLRWPGRFRVNQIAVTSAGTLLLASNAGLFREIAQGWERIEIMDRGGRAWAAADVLGVAVDSKARIWFATQAGVGCQENGGWKFYESKDGLPWNEFTAMASGRDGEVWFGTKAGAIRHDAAGWHYRQGRRWLPEDHVAQIQVDAAGDAWFATGGGAGAIQFQAMTLAQKAEYYENEIEHYIKRTPYGFVAEAHLRRAGDKSSADPQDSDNDGLWTSMYGAGECFAYAATKDPKALERAKHAFEALRFLQKVTQGGNPAPPKGYIARTIRPVEWPDPNRGRIESDRADQKSDPLWKAYEPRWPKSADGKWFWKSDTSSDELDGHYFFYSLYYDLCAETEIEKSRVAEVVRDVTDHLMSHNYALIDHDGKPTRWAIFRPELLNNDPNWWPERGLNSLSMLSYLAAAAHVTHDPKYELASHDLIERHGYAQNAMYPKVQHGPGSGNQSDDEMAFMSYYNLLRCSTDERLKSMIRVSFFHYWANEAPEMNPFFNFAYAGENLSAAGLTGQNRIWQQLAPGWHADAMATLYGFPLDRLNWAQKNSHRLDVIRLPGVRAQDLDSPDHRARGLRVNGKVLPVENRQFNHWNTDPWELDYGGGGDELAAGTVFLLPYYMGLYHGFIEKPK